MVTASAARTRTGQSLAQNGSRILVLCLPQPENGSDDDPSTHEILHASLHQADHRLDDRTDEVIKSLKTLFYTVRGYEDLLKYQD